MLEIVSIDIALSEAAIISISEISDENIEMICIAWHKDMVLSASGNRFFYNNEMDFSSTETLLRKKSHW